MKKVALWVAMGFMAIVCIPLSWMIQYNMAFNVVTNAFFNSSNTTIAFYFIQLVLMMVETEIIIQSFKTFNTTILQWVSVMMLLAFVVSDWYLYYLVLALCSFIAMVFVSRKKNMLKDEITTIIEDVKEEYMVD